MKESYQSILKYMYAYANPALPYCVHTHLLVCSNKCVCVCACTTHTTFPLSLYHPNYKRSLLAVLTLSMRRLQLLL